MSARLVEPSFNLQRALATWVFVGALSAMAGAAPPGLTSTWRGQPVAVDGMLNEWPKPETILRGPEVGAVNDDEFLYLSVSTSDPQLRDLLATGLIVWLDPAGAKAQTLGVWVPGIVQRALPGENPTPAPDTSTGITNRVLDQFDLLGPGKNQRRLVDITPALGIEIGSSTTDTAMIYEVKLPLMKTEARTYAAGVAPGRTVGLGIATPESPRDRGRRGPLVGSAGTVGGSPWRGGGFAPFREKSEEMKPLEVWTTLKLATR